MDTEINEPIKVWAFFDPLTGSGQGTNIFPIAISWRRRLIKLEKVIFTYNQREGGVILTRLVCAGDGATYELEYNRQTLNWHLRKITSQS